MKHVLMNVYISDIDHEAETAQLLALFHVLYSIK